MNKTKLFIPIEKEQRIISVLHGNIMGTKNLIEQIDKGETTLPEGYSEEFLQNSINICNSIYGGIKILSDLCNPTRKEEIYNLIHANLMNLDNHLKQTIDEDQRKKLQYNINQWENILDLITILDRGIEIVEEQKPTLIKKLR